MSQATFTDTTIAPRRGFLRGLLSLPLIGGGVTLIGNPTAAAEPITRELLVNYQQWLFYERRLLLTEIFPSQEERRLAEALVPHGGRGADQFHFPAFERGGWQGVPKPSSRAALVLSAVGCEWRRS